MAILTIHHWPDKEAGLREMRRVTRGRIVLLAFDPSHRPWPLVGWISTKAERSISRSEVICGAFPCWSARLSRDPWRLRL